MKISPSRGYECIPQKEEITILFLVTLYLLLLGLCSSGNDAKTSLKRVRVKSESPCRLGAFQGKF